jgi:putative AlgH/UPF0301 family transcriptional regulator
MFDKVPVLKVWCDLPVGPKRWYSPQVSFYCEVQKSFRKPSVGTNQGLNFAMNTYKNWNEVYTNVSAKIPDFDSLMEHKDALSNLPCSGSIELIKTIEPGCILLAHPRDDDSTFGQSVILILRHNKKNTIGVILNKKEWNGTLHVDQSETFLYTPEVEETGPTVKEINFQFSLDDNLYYRSYGGPVRGDVILHTVPDLPRSKLCQNHPGLYYISPKTVSKRKNLPPSLRNISPKQICLFKGHAHWQPGQLQSEIEQGFWFVARCPSSVLFEKKRN